MREALIPSGMDPEWVNCQGIKITELDHDELLDAVCHATQEAERYRKLFFYTVEIRHAVKEFHFGEEIKEKS